MDRRLLVLALGMFALGTDSFVVAGILPQISHAFHASIGAAGQMTTAYALTYALLAPTIAALAAGIPRKRLLLTGLGLFVVSNLATTIAPSLGLALLSRVLAGVGAATFSPTATGAGAMLVPPERRGFALSVIVAGLTTATALGSPIGAVIGGLSDWRWTLVFVAALGAVAFVGVWVLLPEMPLPPAITLGKRIAPIADARVALTLATTLLAMSGIFTVYTYFSVVFDRAVGGQAIVLGVLLVMWGAAGTVSNLLAGRLIDSFGSHKVIVLMLGLLVVDMAAFPWTSLHVWSAALAIAIWGACGWGILVPQQHRLVTLAPAIAPVLIGLNTASTYFGVTAAGVIGAAAIPVVGGHRLGFVAAVLVAVALLVSELAARRIMAASWPHPGSSRPRSCHRFDDRRIIMLELRPSCECCDRDISPDSPDAFMCSYECTFCRDCTEHLLNGMCPNCGGELVRRPRRPLAKLASHPASTRRVFNAACKNR